MGHCKSLIHVKVLDISLCNIVSGSDLVVSDLLPTNQLPMGSSGHSRFVSRGKLFVGCSASVKLVAYLLEQL